jgi:hypothetical protein
MGLPIYYLPLSTAVGCSAALGAIFYRAVQFGTPDASAGPATSVEALKPVLLVQAAHIFLLYVFLFLQSGTAFLAHIKLRAVAKAKDSAAKAPTLAEVKYGGILSVDMLAADRTVANYLEQSIPFLVSMYLHAALVSASGAAFYGWIWIAARVLYPFVFKMPFPTIFISTMPAYSCVIYMLVTAILTI